MPNITLKRFMIFNSNEGRDEYREGDKLVYHWTKEALDYKVSLAEQIDDICLCDASVAVSNQLNSDCDSHDGNILMNRTTSRDPSINGSFKPNENGNSLVLIFDSTLVLIAEVEPKQSIWMAVHVAPPCNADAETSCQQYVDPSCIPTDAIERVMNNIYARFCLLNGTFQMIVEAIERDQSMKEDERKIAARERMRSICESYFNETLPNVHLNSIVSNVASLYNYILYLDLNPVSLMKVNSFINHLVCVDANRIRHTIVIFNDQLLWSSLNMYDTRLLFNYLVSVLIRDALQEELSKEVDKVRRIRENMPIYLTKDEEDSIENNLSDETIPSDIYENHERLRDRKLTEFYLTVFRSSNNMTLGLILNDKDCSDLLNRCQQILTSDLRLSVIPLASLAQSVGQNFLKANSFLQTSSMQQNQPGASISSPAWRKPSGNNLYLKGSIPADQKYVFMDRLDVSISWPLSMDMLNKEHLLHSSYDSKSVEAQPSGTKLRLIRYLIELEPELDEIKNQSGSSVKEFFGRTLSDSWLTVTNSKYRTIYSVHNVRNSGLSDVQNSAINLKSAFANYRL